MKKTISLLLALVMVLGLLPAASFATENQQVCISVSYDGAYINDKDGGYIAYVGIPMAEIAAVDLNEYGLADYLYDKDGDGTYETTALQLVRSYSAMGTGANVYEEADYTVYYGTAYGNETGTVTTDGSGCANITFPSDGTWYLWCDGGYGLEYPDDIVSTPAYAIVTVTAKEEEPAPEEPEVPREAQDVSAVLNATMAKLAATVTEPVFGTTAGEWTVFSLARGNYYAKDNAYFTDYYNRIAETVNTEAATVLVYMRCRPRGRRQCCSP